MQKLKPLVEYRVVFVGMKEKEVIAIATQKDEKQVEAYLKKQGVHYEKMPVHVLTKMEEDWGE